MTDQFIATAGLLLAIGYLPVFYLISGKSTLLRFAVIANAAVCAVSMIICILLAIWL